MDTGVMAPPQRTAKRGRLGRAIGWAVLAAVLVLIWPSSLGGATTVVVVSGQSMEPTYSAGDLVVLRSRGTYEVSDIVAYRPFSQAGASVIHRIIDTDGETFTLRGDNNNFDDPFEVVQDDIQGAAIFMIPRIGKFLIFLASPWVWISLLLIAVGVYFYPSKTAKHSK